MGLIPGTMGTSMPSSRRTQRRWRFTARSTRSENKSAKRNRASSGNLSNQSLMQSRSGWCTNPEFVLRRAQKVVCNSASILCFNKNGCTVIQRKDKIISAVSQIVNVNIHYRSCKLARFDDLTGIIDYPPYRFKIYFFIYNDM